MLLPRRIATVTALLILTPDVKGFARLAPLERSRTVASRRIGGSPDIPVSELPPRPGGAPEQVHIVGGSADGLTVVWQANASSKGPGIARPGSLSYRIAGSTTGWTHLVGPLGRIQTGLIDPAPWYPATNTSCKGAKDYTNSSCYYTSVPIYSVELPASLPPSTTFEYFVNDDKESVRTFSSPPAAGADRVRFGVVGDLGQTRNSSETVANMLGAASTYDAILHCGDLSYADGEGVRWDTYGRLLEPLASRVPVASVGGNHEVASGSENWLAYELRYPNSHGRARSESALWYSFEAGPAHVVLLCSYAAFGEGSSQRGWLAADLAAVDRTRTPWVLVVLHTPWYTSNEHHPISEGAAMRSALEPLLLRHKVDLLFNGHVHAYERTHYVAAGKRVPPAEGIAHVTIGDGGNREQFAYQWTPVQPEWSALREYAYGYGELELNRTHARWRWLRNDDPWNPPGPEGRVGDEVVYATRPAAELANAARKQTRA